MRRIPDIICIGDINDNMIIDENIIDAANKGHLVILGLQASNKSEVFDKLSNSIRFNSSLLKSKRESLVDVERILKEIINLN